MQKIDQYTTFSVYICCANFPKHYEQWVIVVIMAALADPLHVDSAPFSQLFSASRNALYISISISLLQIHYPAEGHRRKSTKVITTGSSQA